MAVSQTQVVTAKKSIGSFSGIAAGIASVWRGNNGPSGLRNRGACECKRRESKINEFRYSFHMIFSVGGESFAHGFTLRQKGSGGAPGGKRLTDLAQVRLCQPRADNVNTIFYRPENAKPSGFRVAVRH